MPPRSETLPEGIHKLTKLLAHLNTSPKLSLTGVKRLRLSLASQNDHFGARHFVKEDLPRIRWANPTLDIEVRREIKTPQEQWKAQMEVELPNGTVQRIDMQDKWSATILKELMDLAGGDPWTRHVQECQKAGTPVIPTGEKVKARLASTPKNLPALEDYLNQHPAKRVERLKAIEARRAKRAPKTSKTSSSSTSPPPPNPFSTSPETSAPP